MVSLHKTLSFVKSGIRILGYFALWLAFPNNEMALPAFILIISEIIGIIEEVGE